MDRLWRSNSSISSRTGCPLDIVNEEDHNVEDNEIPAFTNWTIPKVDTKNGYKTSYIHIFIYKIKILLYPNLIIYVCETPSWRLEHRPMPPIPHKHLYLWSDHCTKGMQWWINDIVKEGQM